MKPAALPSIDALPRLALASGTIEALKWLALGLMTIDHVNKYLYEGKVALMFALGRLTFPLFVFVLAYHLAQPGAFEHGTYQRVMARLALFGALATVPFIALGQVIGGWWPLNVMATLLASTACLYLHQKDGAANGAAAVALFAIGGAFGEFFWPGMLMFFAAWQHCRRPSWWTLGSWIAATASLFLINQNFWALAAFPLIFLAPRVALPVPRIRTLFYAYYPLHFGALWAFARLP